MAEWQPIETGPKDGEHLLLFDGEFVVFGWFEDSPEQWAFFSLSGEGNIAYFPSDQGPTHWMPLPKPPQ